MPDFLWNISLGLFRNFGQSSKGLGRNADLHAPEMFGLKVNGKSAARGPLGMANFVARLGSPPGHVANSAHTGTLLVAWLQGTGYHEKDFRARVPKL